MSHSQPFRHALPVSESLFHEALYLTHAGWERVAPGEPYPQRDAPFFSFEWRDGRTLPEFCLALVVAGSGEFQTHNYTGKLAANDAFLFRPGEWHRHRPSPKTGWTLMWIDFNGDEPLRWLREEAFNLRENLALIEDQKLFRGQFERLLASVHQNPSANSANFSRQAIGLMSHFLTDGPGNAIHDPEEVQDEAVKAAVEYICNFSQDLVAVPAVAIITESGFIQTPTEEIAECKPPIILPIRSFIASGVPKPSVRRTTPSGILPTYRILPCSAIVTSVLPPPTSTTTMLS